MESLASLTANAATSFGRGASFDEFLARDFVSIGAGPIERCMKIDGRRLYLSGATGFFGKNLLSLLAHLQRRGASFRVTALSRSPERFLADQPWCRNQKWLEWETGDALSHWPGHGKYDYILHAATERAADSHLDRLKLFDEILNGTRNALSFAAAHGVKRLLLSGSGAQYGVIPESLSQGVPESALLACDPTTAASSYGEGKRAAEMLATLHGERHGFDVISTRCFAFVGPGLPLDGQFAIGNFIRDALEGSPIQLSTTGEAVRSYLYGADLAVWLLVLLMEAENGSAINIGSDRPIRIVDLANRVRDLVNPRLEVRPGVNHSGEDRGFYVPSIDYAKTLGLDAWTSLDHAIARTADWHRGPGHAPPIYHT
jgi:nucleoside-diphosphate-sugar epimerase